MAGRSNYWVQQETNDYESQAIERIGYFEQVPRTEQEASSYQRTWKNNTMNKETGIYTKKTVKQIRSTGEVFKERSSGRTGYKDEFKKTSTSKIGDKSGYYEYQCEERFRWVSYEDGSSSSRSSKKYLK